MCDSTRQRTVKLHRNAHAPGYLFFFLFVRARCDISGLCLPQLWPPEPSMSAPSTRKWRAATCAPSMVSPHVASADDGVGSAEAAFYLLHACGFLPRFSRVRPSAGRAAGGAGDVLYVCVRIFTHKVHIWMDLSNDSEASTGRRARSPSALLSKDIYASTPAYTFALALCSPERCRMCASPSQYPTQGDDRAGQPGRHSLWLWAALARTAFCRISSRVVRAKRTRSVR